MPLQFEALEALQTLDTQIDRLKRERSRLDDASTLQREMEARRTAHADAEVKLRELKTRLTDAELQLAGIEQKKREFERRLYEGKVSNPKELQAIEREIEMLGRQRGRFDEAVLTHMDEIETATAILARAAAARAAAETAWTEAETRYRAEVTRLDGALADMLPRRKSAAAAIDPATLRRYDDLRVRAGGLAVARVEGNTCSGCRMALPSILVRRVGQRADYVYCENCSRLLLPG